MPAHRKAVPSSVGQWSVLSTSPRIQSGNLMYGSEMQARCHNENHPKRALYGGRGVRVADEWRGTDGFAAFLAHIGRRPSSKHSLDRIDVNRGYEPGNVRWATSVEQNRNRRNSRSLTIGGRTALLVEWAEEAGVDPKRVWGRLIRGWPDAEAVFGRVS